MAPGSLDSSAATIALILNLPRSRQKVEQAAYPKSADLGGRVGWFQ